MSRIPRAVAEPVPVPAKIAALFFTIKALVWAAVSPAAEPGTSAPKNDTGPVVVVALVFVIDCLGYWK